jgi:hypothetical protein
MVFTCQKFNFCLSYLTGKINDSALFKHRVEPHQTILFNHFLLAHSFALSFGAATTHNHDGAVCTVLNLDAILSWIN